LPHSLSRGERVRLALASALAKDPELYILDEPTEGQDQYGLSTLINVLKYIKDFGSSAIIITQEEEFARIVSDRVYQFHDGEVYES
jgi:ABC-type cobalt transport system, ATPase component